MENKTYNGWKNYETWLVNLWLENDEQIYRETRKLKANELKEYVEQMALEDETGFKADLINAVLQEVDWFEIEKAVKGD